MIMAKESKKSSSLYKDSHSRSAARLPICTQAGRRSSGSLPIRRQTSGTAKVVMRLRRQREDTFRQASQHQAATIGSPSVKL